MKQILRVLTNFKHTQNKSKNEYVTSLCTFSEYFKNNFTSRSWKKLNYYFSNSLLLALILYHMNN